MSLQEVVEDDDCVTIFNQLCRNDAADISGPTGHEQVHSFVHAASIEICPAPSAAAVTKISGTKPAFAA